jgi:hypothetical protein
MARVEKTDGNSAEAHPPGDHGSGLEMNALMAVAVVRLRSAASKADQPLVHWTMPRWTDEERHRRRSRVTP